MYTEKGNELGKTTTETTTKTQDPIIEDTTISPETGKSNFVFTPYVYSNETIDEMSSMFPSIVGGRFNPLYGGYSPSNVHDVIYDNQEQHSGNAPEAVSTNPEPSTTRVLLETDVPQNTTS
jgi:hypothetical protein